MGAVSVGIAVGCRRLRTGWSCGVRRRRRPRARRVAPRRRPAPPPRAVAVASTLPSCVVVPELTEGPYYVDENLERSDIRLEHRGRRRVRGRGADARPGSCRSVDGNACVAARGRARRRLALRRARRLLRTSDSGSTRPRIPARLPAHRRDRRARRSRPSIPAGTRAARSTSTSRSAPTPTARAASSSPRSCSSTTRSATQVYAPGVYAPKGAAGHRERHGRDLRAERRG